MVPRPSLQVFIYLTAFLDMSAAAMMATLLSLYLKQEVGLSATAAGSLTSLYGIVQFFSSPIAGAESDLRGYRFVLIVCCSCCMIGYWFLIGGTIIFIATARIIAGLFKHTQNLLRTVVAANLPNSEHLAAFGRLNSMSNVAFIFAPTIAGKLADQFGNHFVFFIVGLMFGAIALIVTFAFPDDKPRMPDGSDDDKKIETKKESKSIWSLCQQVNWPKHWDVMLTRFLLSLTVLLYRSNMSYFLNDKFGAGKSFIGYLSSFQGIVAFTVAFFTKDICSWFKDTIQCFSLTCLVMTFGVVGLVFAPSLSMYTVAIGLLCVCSSLIRTIGYDLSTVRCERIEMGLIMGVSASVVSGARAMSPVLGGFFHDINIHLPGMCAAVLAFSCFIVTVVWTRPMEEKHKIKND